MYPILRSACIAALCVYTGGAFAADMTLTTEQGIKIILHDNGKWELKNPSSPRPKKDIKVTLADNRVVLVMADGEWGFADKEMTKYDDIKLDSVRVVGTSKHIDVLKAQEAAGEQALEKLAQKLKASIKNRKLPLNRLKQCIREVEKDLDQQEDFTQGKGWDVKVELKLDRGSILAVVECVTDTTSPAPEAAASAAPDSATSGGQAQEEALEISTPLPPQPGN
jgi:hypothetical protein